MHHIGGEHHIHTGELYIIDVLNANSTKDKAVLLSAQASTRQPNISRDNVRDDNVLKL